MVNGPSLINNAFFEQRHGAAFLFLGERLPQCLATAGAYGAERISLGKAFYDWLSQTGAVCEIIDRSEGPRFARLFDDPSNLFTETVKHAQAEAEIGG